MSKFIYYQTRGDGPWIEALDAGREALIAQHRPEFVTVLSLSALVIEGQSREEMEAICYRGPAYFDLDGETLEQVVPKWKEFLAQLQGYDVDLNQVRLYATGGRGFHCEIPMELFLAKPPKTGVPALFAIYKELAFSLYVDTLDLNVYSGKRGRMWRCAGNKRPNGLYKVPLTPEEALNLTVADYPVLCSAPRQPAPLKPPVLNQKLAVLYAKAEQKVGAAMKRRKGGAKDLELLAQFKGQFPPSLLKVMAGEPTADNLGFHQIALQIAITANALGIDNAKMLQLCEGLVQNHQSDSSRYNTPAKRRDELSRMHAYTAGNVCYTYSRGAVKSLLPRGTATPDLDGVPEGATNLTPTANPMSDGLYLTEAGIFRRTAEGSEIISEMSFTDIVKIVDAVSRKILGFECTVLVSGKSYGTHEIRSDVLVSKSTLQRFCAEKQTGFKGTDNHVSALMSIMRRTAEMNNNVVYLLNREGLDMVQRPDTEEDIQDLVWVSSVGVVTDSPVRYMFRGDSGSAGIYKSDLMNAPPFEANEKSLALIEALLDMNEPAVMANMLGWFVSCFHRQLWDRNGGEFPLLHVYGTAGAGKTQSYKNLAPLFYYKATPQAVNVSANTIYGLKAAVQNSASIPAMLDEYKPQMLAHTRAQEVKNILRAAYNSGQFSKGGHADGLGTSWKDIRVFEFCAPIIFCGEAMETETAILERSIVVPLSKDGLVGRAGRMETIKDGKHILSQIGREMVRRTFEMKIEAWKETVKANKALTAKLLEGKGKQRPETNLAVVLTGLDFFLLFLEKHWPGRFVRKFAEFRQHVLDTSQASYTVAMSEASKVINALSFISRSEDPASEWGLQLGRDYDVGPPKAKGERGMWEPKYLDMDVKRAFYKYVTWAKHKCQMSLYETEDAFLAGLRRHPAVVTRTCANSALRVLGFETIYRFNIERLTAEGVEPFYHPR